MHVVLIALVVGSHIAASASGAVSMLPISSDWCARSMKWTSISAAVAPQGFSCGNCRQTDSSRD